MPQPIPAIVIAGLDATDLAVTTMGIECDLPGSALVTLAIDGTAGRVTWTVSDVTGIALQDGQDVHHPCLSCAMREAILPTLVRLAESGRWDRLVITAPVAAEPLPLVLGITGGELEDGRRVADHLRLTSVVAVVGSTDLCSDVFDELLLADAGLALIDDDMRSVGDALVAQIELADTIVVANRLDESDAALLDHLRRPDSTLVQGLSAADAAALLTGTVTEEGARNAVDPRRRRPSGAPAGGGISTIVLESWKPFHPVRLQDRFEDLGSGDQRGRGAFWLPGRPNTAVAWEVSGGRLSIGSTGGWHGAERSTRLVVTGDDETLDIVTMAFHAAIMTDAEMVTARQRWMGRSDGFEEWLDDEAGSDVA